MHENIAKIAAIIRQQPSITAREAASALGYAESKSVYYWLGKIGFTFRGFKAAVLSGVFPRGKEYLAESITPYDAGLPIAARFDEAGHPVLEGATAPFGWPGALFALLWQDASYLPEVAPGDYLVVAAGISGHPQMVVVRDEKGVLRLARLIDEGPEPFMVEVTFRRTWRTPFPALIGRVAAIVRSP